MTALHAACYHRRLECARLLLGAAADPQRPDSDGQTAARWAEIGGSPEVIALFSEDAEVARESA